MRPRSTTRLHPATLFGVAVILCPAALRAQDTAFATLRYEHLVATPASDVAVFDVDQDGSRDLVGVDARALSVYRNDGAGTFTLAQRITFAAPGPSVHRVRIADLDGDGDDDVVVAFGGLGGLWPAADRLFENRAGVLIDRSATAFPPGLDDTRDLWLIDIDADGDVDLVARHGRLDGRAWINDGSGRFTDVTANAFGGAPIEPLDVGDVDGDGAPDLVAAAPPGRGLTAFRNTGRGRWLPTGWDLPSTNPLRAPRIADVDGDGDGDLLVIRDATAGRVVDVAAFDGSGFVVIGTLTDLDTGQDLAVGDLDGDGDTDAVLTGNGAPTALANDGNGTFSTEPLSPGDSAAAFAFGRATLADLDGDARVDLALPSEFPSQIALWFRRRAPVAGLPPFVDGTGFPGGFADVRVLTVGDVDGDRRVDFVGVDIDAGTTVLAAGDGTGHLGPRQPIRGVGTASAAALVDLDGDRDLDLALGFTATTPSVPAPPMILLNDGAGTFAPPVGNDVAPLDGISVDRLVAGDLDGDGAPDLVVFGSTCSTLTNRGRGRVTANAPLIGLPIACGAVVDVDRDGDLDVLVGLTRRFAGSPFGVVEVWRNDGAGGFAPIAGAVPAPNPTRPTPTSCACLDVDRDGDPDLVVGYERAGDVLFLNNGNGSFAPTPIDDPGSPTETIALLVVDVDGDDDDDVLRQRRVSTFERRVDWLRNDGAGTLTFGPADRVTPLRFAALAVDVDADGDPDLVERGIGRNVRSQLALPFRPAPGGLLAVDVWSRGANRPTSAWIQLAAAPATRPVTIPGTRGLYDLDAGSATALGSLRGPHGTRPSRLAVRVPSLSGLSGRSIHIQALLFDRSGIPRWSNRCRDRIR